MPGELGILRYRNRGHAVFIGYFNYGKVLITEPREQSFAPAVYVVLSEVAFAVLSAALVNEYQVFVAFGD